VIIYGGAALVILLFLIGPIRGRTLSRLERLAPGSVAFTISNRRLFGEALSRAASGTVLGRRATGLTSAPCVTADTLGLSFWDNTPLEYVGSLDWSRVASLEVGAVQTRLRRWSASAILVEVEADGSVVVVPLLSPNGTRRMFASRRESEWLARELESLRSSSVDA
jgi:hypothetical protein